MDDVGRIPDPERREVVFVHVDTYLQPAAVDDPHEGLAGYHLVSVLHPYLRHFAAYFGRYRFAVG